MRTEEGDLWDYVGLGRIVIPTNIGWKSDGCNVMGAGLAKQAAERFAHLASWYGAHCAYGLAETPVMAYPQSPLILFPVKPLNEKMPWLSWQSKADLGLIERSARQLSEWPDTEPIFVPMVGCGNGGLDPKDVRPILEKYLSNDRFTLVLQE